MEPPKVLPLRHSGPGGNGNEDVLYNPSITRKGASISDAVYCYSQTLFLGDLTDPLGGDSLTDRVGKQEKETKIKGEK